MTRETCYRCMSDKNQEGGCDCKLIKPCPCCNSKDILVHYPEFGIGGLIACNTCGIKTSEEESRKKMFKIWNTRRS